MEWIKYDINLYILIFSIYRTAHYSCYASGIEISKWSAKNLPPPPPAIYFQMVPEKVWEILLKKYVTMIDSFSNVMLEINYCL